MLIDENVADRQQASAQISFKNGSCETAIETYERQLIKNFTFLEMLELN